MRHHRLNLPPNNNNLVEGVPDKAPRQPFTANQSREDDSGHMVAMSINWWALLSKLGGCLIVVRKNLLEIVNWHKIKKYKDDKNETRFSTWSHLSPMLVAITYRDTIRAMFWFGRYTIYRYCFYSHRTGLLPDMKNCGLRMHLECRERFPCHRLQRTPLLSDPGMHHGTCVTHVPWYVSGSLIRCGGENVLGIPGACATRNFTYLVRDPWLSQYVYSDSHTGLARSLYTIRAVFIFWEWLYNLVIMFDITWRYSHCSKEVRGSTTHWFLYHWRVCGVTMITSLLIRLLEIYRCHDIGSMSGANICNCDLPILYSDSFWHSMLILGYVYELAEVWSRVFQNIKNLHYTRSILLH